MNTFKEVLEPLAEVSVPSLALAGDKSLSENPCGPQRDPGAGEM
jgi:hypothetical protein